MALRLAFWRDSRCISMRHEILAVADECPGVDADQLRQRLDTGAARGTMMQSYLDHREDVQGSPHFFLADGTSTHDPGITMHQEGPRARGSSSSTPTIRVSMTTSSWKPRRPPT